MVMNVAECRCGRGRRTIRTMCQNIITDSKAPRKLSVDLSYSHVRPCSCPFNERKYQSGGGRRVTVVSNKNVPISSSLNRTTESKCLCRCHCKPSRVEFLKGEADKCEGPVDEGGGKRPLVDKAVSTSSLPVKKQTKSSHTKGLRLSPIRQSRSTQMSSKSSSSRSVCTKSDDIPTLQISKPNLLDVPFETVLEKLERLNSFRKDNYFDCHSASSLVTTDQVEEHKCVHKYKINERLIPEPLNADQWGTSRCVICNRARKVAVEKGKKKGEVSNQLPKSKEPTKLNIVGRRETIEYTLPASLDGFVGSTKLKRFGNIPPVCSYALRQQKGVVK